MKKLLLASVAVSGLAFAAAPAHAEIELEVGGYFKGYGVYTDADADEAFDIIRDTELHLGGETTLDNGLTVGVHFEFDVDGKDSASTDESYVYFSGDWGRVNFGAEDGAAYLLQVAAPSADSNIDGIRNYVDPTGIGAAGVLDYDLDPAGKADKFTYLSPIFSGFQVGASYTSSVDFADSAQTFKGTDTVMEFAGRYEGQFQNVGVIAGAGYVTAEDEYDGWNIGLDLDIAAFGIGAAYVNEEQNNVDVDTIVVGADYTTGPFKFGASYYNLDVDGGADLDRYTGGVNYEYGPGMSLRGSISYTDEDTTDTDSTAVVIGTQINF